MSTTTATRPITVDFGRATTEADRAKLTPMQARVLARMQFEGRLYPQARGAVAGQTTASVRTLRALVAGGHAHLVTPKPDTGTAPHYAPGTGRVLLYVVRDRDGSRHDETSIPLTSWTKGADRQQRHARQQEHIDFAKEAAQARIDRTGEPHSVLILH